MMSANTEPFIQIKNNHKKRNVCKSPSSAQVSLQTCKTTLTMETTMNDILGTAEITTSRSSSSSSIVTSIRPQTLNVINCRETSNAEAAAFIREALNAWKAKAKSNIVPADRVRELFHELQFSPSDDQIREMVQTAKGLRRNAYGLTFGEFCVLVADFNRFKTYNYAKSNEHLMNSLRSTHDYPENVKNISNSLPTNLSTNPPSYVTRNVLLPASSSLAEKCDPSPSADCTQGSADVFLGGSCNPTTWRQDVAMPALKELGISFYNPQVSNWTPDLIALEHQAKEKARVLFFVMDCETRATAGAIEAAHIAGQPTKQLVLVLHSYKENQCILNERISKQEYLDLSRNQQILRELVEARGVEVHENIQTALQKTKLVLDPPRNKPDILNVVRGAFYRVLSNSVEDRLSLQQCQRALFMLGYNNSLITVDNLKRIILNHTESLEALNGIKSTNEANKGDARVNFDEFCVIAAYLTVLQQEIHESGCISPIKGINVPPPPIFLANMREGCLSEECITIKHVSRTSSCTSVPDGHDSGTSSPLPSEILRSKNSAGIWSKISLNVEVSKRISRELNTGDESDSNDSVFSSDDSVTLSELTAPYSGHDFRDVYLGGSCLLRTTWRQQQAIPYFTSKGITFHLPALHESIQPSQLPDCMANETNEASKWPQPIRSNLYNHTLLQNSKVLLFVITNETRSLAPMTLVAHCIGLMKNVVLCVQMLPEFCIIGNEKLTPVAIKDYNRGRSYLIDLAKRQGVPVFSDLKSALECTAEKVKACNSRNSV